MVHPRTDGIRHAVKAAFLLDIVVAAGREQRGFGEFLLLSFDDVADVDQLVLIGVERDDLSRRVLEQIGDDAARHRRDNLLAYRRVGDDGVVDRVAAGLLVIGDEFFERNILLFGETLDPPGGSGFGCGLSNVWPRQRGGRSGGSRATQQRTSGQIDHAGVPSH